MENEYIANTENENSANENQTNNEISENTIINDDEYENTTIERYINETIQENTVVDNSAELQNEKLEQIHSDLGFICSFLILLALVIVFRYVYKFFDMFFKF